MQIQVLPFGILKDSFGPSAFPLELPEGATVAQLLTQLSATAGDRLRGIAVSVNAEYAQPTQVLHNGDEVGLLPPVSGGSGVGSAQQDVVYITREVIPADKLIADAKHESDGAVVVFDGIVRNNTRGRQTLHLDYESYEEMALKQMHELAAQAHERFGVRHVSIVHRLGRLVVGETSVLIIVASAHRAHAYEASRFLIDTLKKTVPIWKKETFVDGAVWADGDPFPESIAISSAPADSEPKE